jgi:hypothetical protein
MLYGRIALLFSAVIAAACAGLHGTPATDLLGDPAPVAAATRTIVLTPATRHVNVTGGQIVKFVNGEKSFAWNFDGAEDVSAFDLARVAPAGTLDHQVMAYIAPNPMYMGGGRRGNHGGPAGGIGGGSTR